MLLFIQASVTLMLVNFETNQKKQPVNLENSYLLTSNVAGCSQNATVCTDTAVVARAQHIKCGDTRCRKSNGYEYYCELIILETDEMMMNCCLVHIYIS